MYDQKFLFVKHLGGAATVDNPITPFVGDGRTECLEWIVVSRLTKRLQMMMDADLVLVVNRQGHAIGGFRPDRIGEMLPKAARDSLMQAWSKAQMHFRLNTKLGTYAQVAALLDRRSLAHLNDLYDKMIAQNRDAARAEWDAKISKMKADKQARIAARQQAWAAQLEKMKADKQARIAARQQAQVERAAQQQADKEARAAQRARAAVRGKVLSLLAPHYPVAVLAKFEELLA